MDLTRRKTLYGSSLAAFVTLAGCLEDDPEGDSLDGTDGNGDDDDGNGDEENGDDGDEGGDEDDETDPDDEGGETDEYSLIDYETYTYSIGQGETDAEPLYSESDADAVLDEGSLSDETRKEIDGFLEETDFETAKIVFLRVRAQNLCYGLEIEEIGVDEGATVTASAVDESGSDEACATAERTLCGLVRMEFEGEVPKSGSVQLTDSWGNSHGIGYSSDAVEIDDGEE